MLHTESAKILLMRYRRYWPSKWKFTTLPSILPWSVLLIYVSSFPTCTYFHFHPIIYSWCCYSTVITFSYLLNIYSMIHFVDQHVCDSSLLSLYCGNLYSYKCRRVLPELNIQYRTKDIGLKRSIWFRDPVNGYDLIVSLVLSCQKCTCLFRYSNFSGSSAPVHGYDIRYSITNSHTHVGLPSQ